MISVDDSIKFSFVNNCFLIEKILTSTFPFRIKLFLVAKKLQKGIIKNKYPNRWKLISPQIKNIYNK